MLRNKIEALAMAAGPVPVPDIPGIDQARIGKYMMQAGAVAGDMWDVYG